MLLVALVYDSDSISGWVAVAVSTLYLVRLARRQGWQCTSVPLLWILHVAYALLPIGFGLLAVSLLTDHLSMAAALHALPVGEMGTMIMAMMTRATLGHSGRPLHANRLTTLSYIFLTPSRLARVFGKFEVTYLISGSL